LALVVDALRIFFPLAVSIIDTFVTIVIQGVADLIPWAIRAAWEAFIVKASPVFRTIRAVKTFDTCQRFPITH